jgi:hypothetical protein
MMIHLEHVQFIEPIQQKYSQRVASNTWSYQSRKVQRDIGIDMTHHEGALEEFKPKWAPIVEAELKKRMTL